MRQDRTRELAHACLGCALREDIVPAIREAALGRPEAIILALPVSAEPVPVLRALTELADEEMISIGAVLTAVTAGDLAWDLCGSDLLTDRGLGLTEDDDRGLGEVLARQIESSDVVVTTGEVSGLGAAVVEHIRRPESTLVELHAVDTHPLMVPRSVEDLESRGDPLRVPAPHAVRAEGVWSLELESWRPMHPERLRDALEMLAGTPGRSRGVFWLPTRPQTVGHWDAAGGQLSMGALDGWAETGHAAHSRMVVTGVDGDPVDVETTFVAALLTDSELASGLHTWAHVEDGYDPWLGHRNSAA